MEEDYTLVGPNTKRADAKVRTDFDLNNKENFYYKLIGLEIHDLRHFISDTEASISEYEKICTYKGERGQEFVFIDKISHYRRVKTYYPLYFRNSMMVTIYSLIEVAMNDICKDFQMKENSTFKIGDFSGKGIFKAELYIQKVIAVKLPNEEWTALKKYNKARNQIVHNRGLLSNKDIKAIPLINSLEGVKVTKKGFMELDETACLKFLEITERFFKKLCKSLPYIPK